MYMAVPRLREERCFWELDPRGLRDLKAAASIQGALRSLGLLGGASSRPGHPR